MSNEFEHWMRPTAGLGGLSFEWWGAALWGRLPMITVGAIAGASGSRLSQYGILGAVVGAAALLVQ